MRALSSSFAAVAGILIAGAWVSGVAAQDRGERSLDQYRCRDLLRETGAARDVAVAFVHGYVLGKAAAAKFNIEALQKQTDAFIERCLDNPQENALGTMLKVKE